MNNYYRNGSGQRSSNGYGTSKNGPFGATSGKRTFSERNSNGYGGASDNEEFNDYTRNLPQGQRTELNQRKQAISMIVVSLMDRFSLPEAHAYLKRTPQVCDRIVENYEALLVIQESGEKWGYSPFWYNTKFIYDSSEEQVVYLYRNEPVQPLRKFTRFKDATAFFEDILQSVLNFTKGNKSTSVVNPYLFPLEEQPEVIETTHRKSKKRDSKRSREEVKYPKRKIPTPTSPAWYSPTMQTPLITSPQLPTADQFNQLLEYNQKFVHMFHEQNQELQALVLQVDNNMTSVLQKLNSEPKMPQSCDQCKQMRSSNSPILLMEVEEMAQGLTDLQSNMTNLQYSGPARTINARSRLRVELKKEQKKALNNTLPETPPVISKQSPLIASTMRMADFIEGAPVRSLMVPAPNYKTVYPIAAEGTIPNYPGAVAYTKFGLLPLRISLSDREMEDSSDSSEEESQHKSSSSETSSISRHSYSSMNSVNYDHAYGHKKRQG